MNLRNFDAIIIGGGPIGLACGIEAKKNGLTHLILEKGCLVNSIYNYPTNMTFFSTSDRLEIGGVPFISHGHKPTRREALEYYRRVAISLNLNVHTYEPVETVQKGEGGFEVHSSRGSYQAKKLIVATGFYDHPNLLKIPGEELEKVRHYYDEPHPYVSQRIAVIGAGNSAVDVALETFRCNAEVTMVIREPVLKESIKYWVRPDIENRIAEGSIRAYFNSRVTAIRKSEIDIDTPKGMLTLPNDFVLAMTGYHPDYDLLKRLGLEIEMNNTLNPVYDETTCQSSVPGIYLAGVVIGGMETNRWFIENSREHAVRIFKHIMTGG